MELLTDKGLEGLLKAITTKNHQAMVLEHIQVEPIEIAINGKQECVI